MKPRAPDGMSPRVPSAAMKPHAPEGAQPPIPPRRARLRAAPVPVPYTTYPPVRL